MYIFTCMSTGGITRARINVGSNMLVCVVIVAIIIVWCIIIATSKAVKKTGIIVKFDS